MARRADQPRTDADNDEVAPGDSLAEPPVSEIAAELDGFRTVVVFALQLDTCDGINGDDHLADGDDCFRETGPTAFFGHVGVEPEYAFGVAAPDSHDEGSGSGVIDVGTA